ncbi:MAG: 30S ribosomal protein S18 [Patescibacteria group bacterium]|jgi:small subunit ribosomal protein S18
MKPTSNRPYNKTSQRNNPRNPQKTTQSVNLQSLIESQIDIDYKNIDLLRRFTTGYAKVVPRRRSGIQMHQQRKIAQAIKRARYMGLLPYENR